MINLEKIIIGLSKKLNLKEHQIKNTLNLLSEGNTIPFIARYRKEATGNMDEEQIYIVNKEYEYALNLEEKKEWTINAIEKKGKLTDELVNLINNAQKLVELENIYKPYMDKKKTRAGVAISLGFEPLAKFILGLPKKSIVDEVNKYVSKEHDYNQVLQFCSDIIAEIISDDYDMRQIVKNSLFNYGYIITKLLKIENDKESKYKLYYDAKFKINKIQAYKFMAINRAKKEKVINVKFSFDSTFAKKQIIWKYTKNFESEAANVIKNAINDGFSRLLLPSIENEIWNELFDISESQSIDVFAMNLEHILSQSPLKEKNILGIDPGFRTGCKIAYVNKNNQVKHIDTIFPNEPHNNIFDSEKIIFDVIKQFPVDIIAIGNGTASRETEIFINNFIKKNNLDISHVIVSEAGASVYSASEIARKEFPELSVEKRSAISIARRIIDPLSELIKIDPKSIGVGQYQHDITTKKLDDKLDFIIKKIVNRVGVDLNTASAELLNYVSGLSNSISKEIVKYREKHGRINSRETLKEIPKITNKIFEQASGFLRIKDGVNILDETSIHPSNYELAKEIINKYNIDLNVDNQALVFSDKQISEMLNIVNNDEYILNEILDSIRQQKRDYREKFDAPLLRDDVLNIDSLKTNMTLNGVVRNVCDFGVFIDIGIKNDGFLHFNGMKNYDQNVNHYQKYYIGQILNNIAIKEIDYEHGRVELTEI